MTKIKKTKTKNKSLYHPTSTISKNRKAIRQNNLFRNIILVIIFLASITVVIAAILSFFLTKESLVKSRITELTTDYYENYFYPNLTHSDKYQSNPDKESIMENYHTHGLARTTLNDLLLYDNQKNFQYSDFLSKYCDINKTYVQIFPEPPYEQNSYQIKYHYSCQF